MSTCAYGGGYCFLIKDDVEPDPKPPGFNEAKKCIHVFRCNGKLIGKFEIPRDIRVLTVEYLQNGLILVLYLDSTCVVYTQKGIKIKSFKTAMDPRTQQ